METIYWILIFGLLMSCIALAGCLLLFLNPSVLDAVIMPLIAFAAGSLIGGAMFHMVPHAIKKMGNETEVYVLLVAGFALFLGLEQFLNWHHSHTHSHTCVPFSPLHQEHHCVCSETTSTVATTTAAVALTQSSKPSCIRRELSETHMKGLDVGIERAADLDTEDRSTEPDVEVSPTPCCTCNTSTRDSLAVANQAIDEEAVCVEKKDNKECQASGRQTQEEEPSDRPHKKKQPLGYLILIADAVHNFIGGLFVGASFVDSTKLGLTAWLSAAAHEVPQELGDFAILVHAGWSPVGALNFNFLSALTFPLGAIVAYISSKSIDVSFLVPFAAGNFLYIAATDLIPEVKHHHGIKEGVLNYTAFLSGIGLLLVVRIAADGW